MTRRPEVARTTGRPPPIETTILTHSLPCEAVGPAIAFRRVLSLGSKLTPAGFPESRSIFVLARTRIARWCAL